MLVDVYESREAADRFARDRFGPASQQRDMPMSKVLARRFVNSVARICRKFLAAGRQVSDRCGSQRRSLGRGRATGPRELNVVLITMSAMAALGVRSGSLPFGRPSRRRCKQQVSANTSERTRTAANPCHAEGRGFESHHPLHVKPPETGAFVCPHENERGPKRARVAENGRSGLASRRRVSG